jgi:hypothetical protein
MDESDAWRALAANFSDLARSGGHTLRIVWSPKEWEQSEPWRFAGGSQFVRSDDPEIRRGAKNRFLNFAERAGVLLGAPLGAAAIDHWVEFLRLESPYSKNMAHRRAAADGSEEEADGEVIEHVCFASEELCYRMETLAIARKRIDVEYPSASDVSSLPKELNAAPSTSPTIPPESGKTETIGEQINRLRHECRLTVEQLAEKIGVDRRTVERHIADKRIPYSRHISAYERVFSKILETQVVISKMPGRCR